jgi:hypothetical protein
MEENFTWTPDELVAMTKEIDKICPEECTFDLKDVAYDTTTGNNDRAMTD